ncbi:hypothetical protein [Noviherbaspirillum humi]|uniref:hypothetical protein n=1 Tax=Noviherbaspirillum humi TaxID=1688639 RepID=UPI001595A0AF|nr:hypothetical protein [Noviherbaspirillum humi]
MEVSNRLGMKTHLIAGSPAPAISLDSSRRVSSLKGGNNTSTSAIQSEIDAILKEIKKLETSTCSSANSWNAKIANLQSRIIALNKNMVTPSANSSGSSQAALGSQLQKVNESFNNLPKNCVTSADSEPGLERIKQFIETQLNQYLRNIPLESGGY